MNTTEKQNFEALAYEQLKQAIIKGIYPPGAQIIEESIANQLNISRSPVRSAIKMLEAEGFLEKHPNRRMYVAHGSLKKTLDALYIRKALEGIAAYQAAYNHTEEDVLSIRSILEKMKEGCSSNDSFTLLRLGIDIHKAVYNATKNPQLTHIGINVLEQEAMFSFKSLSTEGSRMQDSYVEHTLLAEAIFQRNAPLAEERARAHIDVLLQRVRRTYDEKQKNDSLLIHY